MSNEIYISLDIETDGPAAGLYSMLSFGASAFALRTEDGSWEHLSGEDVYYELQPISHRFDPEAMAVNGLDRDRLCREGMTSYAFYEALKAWVEDLQQRYEGRVVFCAYPAVWDWSFVWYYIILHTPVYSKPFVKHSACTDFKSRYAGQFDALWRKSTRSSMPDAVLPKAAHTHNALDDAREQGEMFWNIATFVA